MERLRLLHTQQLDSTAMLITDLPKQHQQAQQRVEPKTLDMFHTLMQDLRDLIPKPSSTAQISTRDKLFLMERLRPSLIQQLDSTAMPITDLPKQHQQAQQRVEPRTLDMFHTLMEDLRDLIPKPSSIAQTSMKE